MIDGSEKCKCQLAFRLQSSHVFEKRSNMNTEKGTNYEENLKSGDSHPPPITMINHPPDPSKKQLNTVPTYYNMAVA